jgi:hypothetical protein
MRLRVVAQREVPSPYDGFLSVYRSRPNPEAMLTEENHRDSPYRSLNRSRNPILTHFRSPLRPFNLTPSLTSLLIPLQR